MEYLQDGNAINMKIKLFYSDHQDTTFLANVIKEQLVEADFEVTTANDFDLGIAIGGDGTFLHMVTASNFRDDVLYVGINNGTLGFLQEIKPNELTNFIEVLKNKQYRVEEVSYEEITINTDQDKIHINALNEVVLRDVSLRTAYFDIAIDEDILENYVGDGIMVSTPIGSTAYNLSCNGAVIYNNLKALEITPLAPINNYVYRTLSNSVIIPDDKIIHIKPTHRTTSIAVFIDGINHEYDVVNNIEIKLSQKRIKVIRLYSYNYTSIIYNKFLN